MKYVGYQNELASFVGETREELEKLPMVNLTEIKEVEFAEMYNGVIYTDQEELTKAKQDYVRGVRNQYLVDYVDGAVSNPLRWADMSQELRDMYTNYRQYLLDYTESDGWWEQNPMTLDEWKQEEDNAIEEG